MRDITINDVGRAISNTNNWTSPGLDKISIFGLRAWRNCTFRGGSRGGRRGLEPRSDLKLPNSRKIKIIGFYLSASSHKSNFHANHAHHTHRAKNWSVEPLSDFRLDPPLLHMDMAREYTTQRTKQMPRVASTTRINIPNT